MKQHINIPIFIPHLGCMNQCVFCNQKKISSIADIPDDKQIKNKVQEYLTGLSNRDCEVEIAFFGGSFTALAESKQQYFLDAVQEYLSNSRVTGIRISTRPDCISEENLQFLKEKGVSTIELGVQSLDEEVLLHSGRGYQYHQVENACHLIKAQGMQLGIQLMIGLPCDNREKCLLTAKKVVSFKPDMVRIYPTLVIKGTELEVWYEKGEYKELSLEEAVETCKEMAMIFQQENINIIRMGIQPSEELQQGDTVIAGPYHSAFGELVEQAVFKGKAAAKINVILGNNSNCKLLTIWVNSKDVSKMIGYRRTNIRELCREYQLDELIVKTNPNILKNEIIVEI